MFRRRSFGIANHLMEPLYESDLAALGFVVDGDEFIRRGSAREFFDFHHTENERENVLRKEAMHASIRKVLLKELGCFDLGQIYLNDNTISQKKPEDTHLSILATKTDTLSTCKHVLVVVGEQSQDLGVWSWRLLKHEHGLTNGGAVGMAGMVRAHELSQRSDLEESLEDKVGPMPSFVGNWARNGIQEDPRMGIIVLNPGQLLYSPLLHTCMTHAAWQARRRAHALADEFEIDEVHNRIPGKSEDPLGLHTSVLTNPTGHTSPEQHVATFFRSILPQLTRADARIYVVGVTDGADHVLDYLDKQFAADPDGGIARKLEALALIQPNYSLQSVRAEALRVFLRNPNRARAWVMSEEPKGRLVNSVADPLPTIVASPADEDALTPTPWNMPTPTQHTFNTNHTAPTTGSGDVAPVPKPKPKDDGDGIHAYDYGSVPPICATFSGGVPDILENVWPCAMGDVLTFLFDRQRLANEGEGKVDASRRRPAPVRRASTTSSNMTEAIYGR